MKTFEQFIIQAEDDDTVDLVGYPEGNIITVTEEEFEEIRDNTNFDIQWDDEPDYTEGITGQWRFSNDGEAEEEIEV